MWCSLLILVGFGVSACAPLTPPVPTFSRAVSATEALPSRPTGSVAATQAQVATGPGLAATSVPASDVLMTPIATNTREPATSAPTATLLLGLERVPTSEAPILGEAPETVVESVLTAARTRLGLAPDAPVTVIRAQAVIWPDGALGCPQPGMAYTQAEVEGYWIEVETAGQVLDYRMSDAGYPWLCVH